MTPIATVAAASAASSSSKGGTGLVVPDAWLKLTIVLSALLTLVLSYAVFAGYLYLRQVQELRRFESAAAVDRIDRLIWLLDEIERRICDPPEDAKGKEDAAWAAWEARVAELHDEFNKGLDEMQRHLSFQNRLGSRVENRTLGYD